MNMLVGTFVHILTLSWKIWGGWVKVLSWQILFFFFFLIINFLWLRTSQSKSWKEKYMCGKYETFHCLFFKFLKCAHSSGLIKTANGNSSSQKGCFR